MAAPADRPEFKGNVTAIQTAPFWPGELTDIEAKRVRIGQMRQALDLKHKDHVNADGTMTDEQKNEFMKKFEADFISPAGSACGIFEQVRACPLPERLRMPASTFKRFRIGAQSPRASACVCVQPILCDAKLVKHPHEEVRQPRVFVAIVKDMTWVLASAARE